MRRPPAFTGPCKLCLRESELRRSHVVPEFLYAPLYDPEHKIMVAHGRGHRGWETAQLGLRERLLCADCERFLNDELEKPFRRTWIEASQLPTTLQVGRTYQILVPYRKFKLFHWSVLWRASISRLGAFAQISLGKYEEEFRRRLLALDAGPAWRFPIVGYLTVLDGKPVRWISAMGRQTRLGLNTSCITYGGAHWVTGVGSHRSLEFERIALQQSGDMGLATVDAMTASVVQTAMEFVRVPPT